MKKVMVFMLLIHFQLLFSQIAENILTIGDSNGAFSYGWPVKLQNLIPQSKIYNISIPGNTIGFDNNGQERLNTLKNIEKYLSQAQDSLKKIDLVIIMLGTNDSKYVFKDKNNEVINNLKILLERIKNFDYTSGKSPRIMIVAPPPMGKNNEIEEKYAGGEKRLHELSHKYKHLSKKEKCLYVDVYKSFRKNFMKYSADGVHLNESGQKIIANKIKELIY